jgi:hypothetical protein
MHNLQFVWVKIQVTMQDAPNTPLRHDSHLSMLTGRSPGTAADGSQRSGNVLGCANWGRQTRWLFIRDRAFFTPLPCPPTDFNRIWSFKSISCQNPLWVSTTDPARTNKQSHSTSSVTPQRLRRLISKFTALVRHDTLAEKRVTKILICFIISAGPSIYSMYPRLKLFDHAWSEILEAITEYCTWSDNRKFQGNLVLCRILDKIIRTAKLIRIIGDSNNQ